MKKLVRISTAAVKDIPAELKNLINKHWNFKDFTSKIYRISHKDLEDLEIAPDTFSKKKVKSSDLYDIVKNGDKFIITDLEMYGKDVGILFTAKSGLGYYKDGNFNSVIEYNGKLHDALNTRTHVQLFNNDDIKKTSWIIDLSKAKSTEDIIKERKEAQEGIIQRYIGDLFTRDIDKSGYRIDKNKYNKMLNEMKREGNEYVERISKITNDFLDMLGQLQKAGIDNYKYHFDVQEIYKKLGNALDDSTNYWDGTKASRIKESINEFEEKVKDFKDKFKKEVTSAVYNENNGEIRFDSISGGFDIYCDPFYSTLMTSERYVDLVRLNTFSSGSSEFIKDIDEKTLNEYKQSFQDRTSNKYYGQAKKEAHKIDAELLKAAKDFDKAVEAIMKKHGYRKSN